MRIMAEQKLICNGCGRSLKIEQGILREDVFEGKKQWGYFSKRDGEIHSFLLCQDCYEKVIKNFAIAPAVTEVTEF
jgi:ribosomal-protein-alanine N-acetyltransferase